MDGALAQPAFQNGEWQVRLNPVVHHLWRDASAFTAFEAGEAIAFHRSSCARQIGSGLVDEACQLVERPGRVLGDDTQQFPIAVVDRLTNGVRGCPPQPAFPPRMRNAARLQESRRRVRSRNL